MREVVLGTAGHVDHGKTSLIRALTGIDTDRLKEEKERGITIELGFAYLDLPCGHRLGIVDVPGHERFVKNMVAGAAGIDLVAFVIAADEGIMPQSREHFDICRLLCIKKGFVVLTKIDLVEPDWLEMVIEEVKEFFSGSFLDNTPIVPVSSVTGQGIDKVRNVIDGIVKESDFSQAHGPFRMPVDRVFTMKGFGAVVTGTSISGRIAVGDEAEIFPKGIKSKIRTIQVHAADVKEAEAGHRTAINLQGLEKEAISRGDMLATPGCLAPTYMLDADFLYLADNKKRLKNRKRIRFHLGTAEIMGRIVLLENEELEPGTKANIQILLEEPVVAWPKDRFVIRSYSPVYTIGGGMVFNASPPKRRRFKSINKDIFRIYHEDNFENLALLHLRETGAEGLTFSQLEVKTGIFGNRLKKLLDKPISARKIIITDSESKRMIEASVYEKIAKNVLQILDGFHKQNPMKAGLAKEELKSRIVGGIETKLFHNILGDLSKKGDIVTEEAIVRLAGHEIAVGKDAESLRKEIDDFYFQSGLAVPTIKEVHSRFNKHPQKFVREIIGLLVQEGSLEKITEDLYFNSQALTKLEADLIGYIQKEGEIDAPKFKTMTGLSRKFIIPLLEHFDKKKVTIRVGDKRILREQRR